MNRIEKLQTFLDQNPADNFIQHALALEYIKEGKSAEARKLFEDLLSRDEKYVGSYYHLGKLLETMGHKETAVHCYEKGMKVAQELGDQHAYNELQAAYEDLTI
jgi:Tfp pilus assembly protein PilF